MVRSRREPTRNRAPSPRRCPWPPCGARGPSAARPSPLGSRHRCTVSLVTSVDARILAYQGKPPVACALQFAPLVSPCHAVNMQ